VGEVKKTGQSGASVTINMAVNTQYSPTTVATGGVAFHPLAEGTTIVEAAATGFKPWSGSAASVAVSQPSFTFQPPSGVNYVGSGLQIPYNFTLGGSNHGGVTVRISSSDPLRLAVSPDATTLGTSFIEVFIPDGQAVGSFYVQGKQGITGNITLTASSPRFKDGTGSVAVVDSIMQIVDLPASIAVSADDNPFVVYTGILQPGSNSVWMWQPASAAAPIHVLLTSSNASVGMLRTAAEYLGSVAVEVPINSYISAYGVGNGGVAFDPISVGNTTVYGTAIGFVGWAGSSVAVAVTP
jgi:hypothetical protein